MKIARYTAFLAGVVLAAACEKAPDPERKALPEGISVTLRVENPLAATKTTVPGDGARNENKIQGVDVFLFSGDGGAGTEVLRKVASATQAWPYAPAPTADPTEYTLSVRLTKQETIDLFGTDDPGAGNSATAKMVVVANGDPAGGYLSYPSAPASVQGIKEAVATTLFDAWWAENLRYIIMCGEGTVTLAHTATPDEITATGTIDMRRSYAKLDMALDLPAGGLLEVSGRTYQADLDNISIELLNVVKNGYVGSDGILSTAEILPTTNPDPRPEGTPYRKFTVAGTTATHNAFYSYPRNFSDAPAKKTEFRIRIPWKLQGESEYTHIGHYSFPVTDLSSLEANHYYHSEAAIRTLGAADAASPEALTGSWTLLDWGDAPVYGKFNDYQYLIAHPSFVTMHGVTVGNASYQSSSAVSAVITEVKTYGIDMDGEGTDGDETSRIVTGAANLARYAVTIDTENKTITLNHPLELEGGTMYYRQEITVTLTNADSMTETIVFEQTPAIDLRSTGHMGTIDNFFVDGYRIGDGGYLGADSDSPYVYCQPPKSESSAKLRYNLRITVSSFSSSNNTFIFGDPAATPVVRHEYIIGDPRISQNKFAKEQFSRTNNDNDKTYQWDKSELDKIKITNSSIEGADYISPEFICSTGLATSYVQTRDNLEMRAAMYQECGYPAGRWRLMTEAEFKFLADLQIAKKIPTLFMLNNTGYYTAQGTCYKLNAEGTAYKKVLPTKDKAFARFVYDTWYWGREPDPDAENTYSPQP